MTLFKLNRNPKVLPLDIQLQVPTPKAWLAKAANSLQELLSDHAECEKKAAITAINFTRYFHEYNQGKQCEKTKDFAEVFYNDLTYSC